MVDELVNPYIAGAPVTEARMFFGREDVFQWIENSIAGQYTDHILVIHGQRRVGKTSVLKQLGNRLPKRYIPVFFDLQGRTHTTLDRFLWWLARETVRVLKQERDIEIPLPEKEAFSADLEYFENQFLPGLHLSLNGSTLLLTFDEFDSLEESEIKETLGRPLIDYLRRMTGNTDLNFIFSIGSSGRKLENMQASYTEFFKTALYKKISFLNEEQTHKLITHPVEGILEYDKPATNRIFRIAGGHPYFTQLTCHELFARCQRTDQRHIREADVEAIVDDVVERGTVNLKFVWDEASDIEKWALSSLAHLDKPDNRTLAAYLRKQNVRFSESDMTSGLLHLREKDILTAENRFVIHLLRLWLQKNRPIEQVREELTEVNPIANRYTEIGLEFKNSGQYEKAIESFQEALTVSAGNIQAQVSIALVYMDQKAHDKAVGEFEKALAIDDEDVTARAGLCEAHLALGDEAFQKGRWKEAAQSYQRVLGINKEHTEARQRMAEINRQRAEKALGEGRDEEALSAFADALNYAPEDKTLSERLEAVKAEKKTKVIVTQIARSEKEAGAKNWEAAVHSLEEAYRLAPDDTDIQRRLAEAREKLREAKLVSLRTKAQGSVKAGKFGEALNAWQEYLSLEPQDRKEIEEEIARLNKLQELEETYSLAQRAITDKKYDKAIGLLKEVIVKDESYKDTSRLLVQAIELRRSSRTSRFTLPVFTILKGLFMVIVIAGLGVGAYFAWNQWGNNLTSLFAVEQKVEKVCFIMTGSDVRSSMNKTVWQGILDAAEIVEIQTQSYITGMQPGVVQETLDTMYKEDCNFIIGNGEWLKDQFLGSAGAKPNVYFLPVDVSYKDIPKPLPDNLIEQSYAVYDGAYLAGYLAAGSTQTGKVGTFGGEQTGSVLEYMDGFVAGVQRYNAEHNAQVEVFGWNPESQTGLFAGDFGNHEAHTLHASNLIQEGADIIFIASTIEASQEAITMASASEEPQVKIIGVDMDWKSHLFKTQVGATPPNTILASVIKNDDVMVSETIKQLVSNTYKGDAIEGTLNNNGVELTYGKIKLDDYAKLVWGDILEEPPLPLQAEINRLWEEFTGIPKASLNKTVPPLTATPDPRTSNPANQHLYQYMEQGSSWHDARDVCASQGGYLVTIQDTVENDFIYQLTKGNTWLGATDEIEEGTWVWVNGEPWDFQNWEQGEPNHGNLDELEHYLRFWDQSSSTWNDFPEGISPFVCEWEPASGVAITQTPTLDPAIQIALDAIKNNKPLYEKSFEFSWDREYYDGKDGAQIDAEKLIVTSVNMEPGTGYLLLPPGTLISDMSAVEFEFRVLESGPEGTCGYEYTSADEGNWLGGIWVTFTPDGQANLNISDIGDLAPSPNRFDPLKSNTFLLINLGGQIASFINGQIIHTASKPEWDTTEIIQSFHANNTSKCEFDNSKYWDLSGVDFNP